LYAWDRSGHPLKGFPRYTQKRFWTLPVPTPHGLNPHTKLPDRGSLLAPVLAPLEGGKRLDIILSAFDGFVYAWRPNGSAVPGWPVQVKLPQADFARDGVDPKNYERDAKLMYPVAVGDLDGSHKLRVMTAGITGPAEVIDGNGSVERTMSADCASADCSSNPPYRPSGDSHTITLTGQAVLGDLTGSGHPQLVQNQTG